MLTRKTTRRHRLVATAILTLFLSVLAIPSAATHGEPVVHPGNPDCADLGFAIGFKVEPPVSGTYTFTSADGQLTGLGADDPSNSFTMTTGDGVFFDWTSTLPLDVVIVKGGPNANVYTYDPEETADTGLHSPINTNGQPFGLSHVEVCYDYEVTASKTAETSFTRTWDWSITKSVSPALWDLFRGDTATSLYTVTATKAGFTDSDWAVQGTLTIANDTPFDATVTAVGDTVSPAFAVAVDCGLTPPVTLLSGEQLECTYGPLALPDGVSRLNTATVSTEGLVGGAEASAPVVFTDPTTEVLAEVHVTDTNGLPGPAGPVSDTTTWTYERTFACDGDTGVHPNVAEITETGQQAAASVTVQCHSLIVTKDATTEHTRTWDWHLDKSADHGELTLSPGQVFPVEYTVHLDATPVDSDWAASGTIQVHNPHPSQNAVLVAVVDSMGGVAATVDCPALLAAPGATLECTYHGALPDGDERLNEATATQRNHHFAADGTATPTGTTDTTGTAPVIFGEPTLVVDACVDVDDTLAGFLGTFCDSQAPADIVYTLEVGPFEDPADCGENLVDNTASFQSQDTGATGEDSWTVTVTVPCEEGCTLTPGYWKTHSELGPAPYDDTWALLPEGASTPFFLSGGSYLEALWTPPRGNAYWILAHAWIAAELNQLNGASIPPDVLAAFEEGRVVFQTYTPDEVADFKGKDRDKRALILGWAFILDEYNNGLSGPGHCSEEEVP